MRRKLAMMALLASASGRLVYCNINPRTAFGRAPRGRQYYRYD
jgi:hypothetical protein